jgi:hypothetical protein
MNERASSNSVRLARGANRVMILQIVTWPSTHVTILASKPGSQGHKGPRHRVEAMARAFSCAKMNL